MHTKVKPPLARTLFPSDLECKIRPFLVYEQIISSYVEQECFSTRKCLKCTLHQFLQISEHRVSLVSSNPAKVHIISGPVVVTLLCCGRWGPLATCVGRVTLERYE